MSSVPRRARRLHPLQTLSGFAVYRDSTACMLYCVLHALPPVTNFTLRRSVRSSFAMLPADYECNPPATLPPLQVPDPYLFCDRKVADPTSVSVSGLASHWADLCCC
jgi:hypothetical protein